MQPSIAPVSRFWRIASSTRHSFSVKRNKANVEIKTNPTRLMISTSDITSVVPGRAAAVEVELRAGAKFDLLSPKELDGRLEKFRGDWAKDMARAEKWLDLSGSLKSATVSATVGAVIPETPNSGYIWNVRLVSVWFTAASTGVLHKVYDTNVTAVPGPKVIGAQGVSQLPQVFTYGQGQLLVRSGEFLMISGAGTSATVWNVACWEVPEEALWKLAI